MHPNLSAIRSVASFVASEALRGLWDSDLEDMAMTYNNFYLQDVRAVKRVCGMCNTQGRSYGNLATALEAP